MEKVFTNQMDSNITDFEEVVKPDKQYIDNWSFGQDIKILIKTIFVVANRKGSIY